MSNYRKFLKIIVLLVCILVVQTSQAQDSMFEICPLKVGEVIPPVSVKDKADKAHLLSDVLENKPSVLIFYRGAWCGYCIKHLSELNEVKGEIEELGYQIFGITADQSSKLEESNKAAESEIKVFSDSNLDATSAFGLDWKLEEALVKKYKDSYKLDLEEWSGSNHHSLPVPAIFIVKDGMVQFQYVNPNYKIRLKPATLLAILKTI